MASGTGKQKVNKDKEMASHLKKIGYPHGRRMTSPVWQFDPRQVGSNKYVRYIEARRKSR
jgi:hypothetical protein